MFVLFMALSVTTAKIQLHPTFGCLGDDGGDCTYKITVLSPRNFREQIATILNHGGIFFKEECILFVRTKECLNGTSMCISSGQLRDYWMFCLPSNYVIFINLSLSLQFFEIQCTAKNSRANFPDLTEANPIEKFVNLGNGIGHRNREDKEPKRISRFLYTGVWKRERLQVENLLLLLL
mmetsp:Transcript_3174/g.7397  ORF Transcript_3174/g.7397 Transcript_3174/m.7397 type:complete len:179 (+) Transcript_3174:2389-2925(+)